MLPAFDAVLRAKPVLDEKQPAIRFEHSPHLAQRQRWVRDRTKRPGHHNRVYRVIGKRDCSRGPFNKFGAYAGLGRAPPRHCKQAGRRINPDDNLDLFAIKQKVQS